MISYDNTSPSKTLAFWDKIKMEEERSRAYTTESKTQVEKNIGYQKLKKGY